MVNFYRAGLEANGVGVEKFSTEYTLVFGKRGNN